MSKSEVQGHFEGCLEDALPGWCGAGSWLFEHDQGWAALVRVEVGPQAETVQSVVRWVRFGQGICVVWDQLRAVSVALPGCSLEEVETRAGDGPGRGGAVEGFPRMSMGGDEGQVSGPLETYVEGSHKGPGKTPLVAGAGEAVLSWEPGRGGFRGGAEQRPGREGLGASRGHLARPRLVVGGDWPVGGLQPRREVRSEKPAAGRGPSLSPMLCPHPLQANETFALVGNVTHYAQVWLNISAEIRSYLEQGRLQQHLRWLQQVLGAGLGGCGRSPLASPGHPLNRSPPPPVCGRAAAAPGGTEPVTRGAAARPAPGQFLTAQRLSPPAAAGHH